MTIQWMRGRKYHLYHSSDPHWELTWGTHANMLSPVLHVFPKLSEPAGLCPVKSREWEWQTKPEIIAEGQSEGKSQDGSTVLLT